MSIREIEDSIINYLKEKFPQFLVQGFPEKPQEFILLQNSNTKMLFGNTYIFNFLFIFTEILKTQIKTCLVKFLIYKSMVSVYKLG